MRDRGVSLMSRGVFSPNISSIVSLSSSHEQIVKILSLSTFLGYIIQYYRSVKVLEQMECNLVSRLQQSSNACSW